MASVSVPAGESVTLAETAYTVQVHNTGDNPVSVGGLNVEPGARATVYPIAWQPVVATSEKGGTVDVTVTSLGSAEPVTTEAVSHDVPVADSPQEPVTSPEPVAEPETPEAGNV